MSTIRRRWRFTGTVQGVGFRYYARAAALHLGLTGWVANNWDGSVTLEAQGERAALDALVPLIERSNRWARIENIEVTTLPVKEHEYGFGERRVKKERPRKEVFPFLFSHQLYSISIRQRFHIVFHKHVIRL